MRTIKMTYIIYIFAALIINVITINAFAAQKDFEVIQKLEEEANPKPPGIIINRPKVEYTAENLRDPFSLGGSVLKSKNEEITKVPVLIENPPALTLQAMVWGGVFPQAIINNKVVKEGDEIEGARITSIEKSGISVLFKGRQFDLGAPQSGGEPKKPQGGQNEKNP